MAKSEQRLGARDLRKQGMSIIKIASLVNVAKSTVSLWCRDIDLTEEQKTILLISKEEGLKRGQLIGAEVQKKKRLEKIEEFRQKGVSNLKNLSSREFLIAGLALYLAEGSKGFKGVIFTNSDPVIIKFMVNWFISHFRIPTSDFTFYLIINEVHQPREQIVKDYWAEYLGISITQFRKTSFVKTKQKKIYANHDNYYGTIHFRILKSTDLLYKIQGLISGLFESTVVQKLLIKPA
ncbi:MAG: hypothetical protein HYT67_02290 [Candidatus Yanofskybacteria bacterium]|nr:hypothetical protein [Candidatus Yanofskybacteria bacterium]